MKVTQGSGGAAASAKLLINAVSAMPVVDEAWKPFSAYGKRLFDVLLVTDVSTPMLFKAFTKLGLP